MKKFRLFIIILVSLTVLSSVAVMLSNPAARLIAEMLVESRRVSSTLEEADKSDYAFKSVAYENLRYGEKCTFNQAMMLVNKSNPLSGTFRAELSKYENTDACINTSAIESFVEMRDFLTDKFDERLLIMSAYRSNEEQKKVYNESDDESAARAGESEHETGLALDIYVKYYAGKGFIKTEIGQYVNRNCGDFGFIVRYPVGKKSVTGFSYEPWHIRYVGLPHSEIIQSKSITLEEYIEGLELDKFYIYENYLISRQDGDNVIIPEEYDSVTVSPDNMGNYILTVKVR